MHDGVICELAREELFLGGKQIFISRFQASPGDMLISFSDGVYTPAWAACWISGWQYQNIVSYIIEHYTDAISPREMVKKLLGSVNTLYMDKPGDDSTVCAMRIKNATPLTVMVGPPSNSEMDAVVVNKLMNNGGLKVVCGGTTSNIVSRMTGRELEVMIDYENPAVPPTAHIPGIDLVTEGVLTLGKCVEYMKRYTSGDKHSLDFVLNKKDGASQLCRMLLEDCTEVQFLVGQALNPAHQNPGMPLSLGFKAEPVKELSQELEKTGKKVSVEYF